MKRISSYLLALAILIIGLRSAAAWDGYLERDVGVPSGSTALVSAPGIATYAKPPVGAWNPGPMLTAVQGQDNALWVKSHDGGWWGWASLGGIIQSKPAVASPRPGEWVAEGSNLEGSRLADVKKIFGTNWAGFTTHACIRYINGSGFSAGTALTVGVELGL